MGRGVRARSPRGCRRSWTPHGRDACAVYLGNPAAHGLAPLLYGRALLKAIGTKNIFSASTVDQYPKQVAAALMFGTGTSIPIPDLDRTDYLLVLGANPLASNGSLMTAPDVRGRLRAIRARGGKIVVVDPRRTRTAKEADEHLFIRPGTDALLLFALVHVIFEEGLDAPVEHLAGLDEVRELARDFTPEAASRGDAASTPRRSARLARELAAAPTAAVYGRIGTTHAGVRHDGARGWSTCSTRSPATSTGRAARCSRAPPRARRTRAAERQRPRRHVRPLDVARARPWRDLRRAAVATLWPRRSRRRARARSAR